MAMDAQYRKDHAKSRHLGGSNLGFCDGHAKWMASEAILFGGENWSGYATSDPPLLYGLGVCICPEKTNRYH
jgi:prepilin-type processing-associated H-X9-DG protein